jgi:hypothetical protein
VFPDCSLFGILSISLKLDTNPKLTTQLYDKRDDFNFSIVNSPYICSKIPALPAYAVYISQLIRYARTSSIYDQSIDKQVDFIGVSAVSIAGSFRKFYSRYNDLVYPYNLAFGHMLSDMFHTIRYAVLDTLTLTTIHTVYMI